MPWSRGAERAAGRERRATAARRNRRRAVARRCVGRRGRIRGATTSGRARRPLALSSRVAGEHCRCRHPTQPAAGAGSHARRRAARPRVLARGRPRAPRPRRAAPAPGGGPPGIGGQSVLRARDRPHAEDAATRSSRRGSCCRCPSRSTISSRQDSRRSRPRVVTSCSPRRRTLIRRRRSWRRPPGSIGRWVSFPRSGPASSRSTATGSASLTPCWPLVRTTSPTSCAARRSTRGWRSSSRIRRPARGSSPPRSTNRTSRWPPRSRMRPATRAHVVPRDPRPFSSTAPDS